MPGGIRGRAGFGSRGRFAPLGGRGRPTLSLLTGGTFTRSTEASYLTGAPTDGTAAFIAWAGVNVRRVENRGDGLGDMLLLEGARTNYVLQSRDMTEVVAWAAAGSNVTQTADYANGPDGTLVADRIIHTAGASRWSRGQTPVSGAATVALSLWARATATTQPLTVNFAYDGLGHAVIQKTLTTTYERNDYAVAIAASRALYPQDRTLDSNTASDVLLDLHQLEIGAFPSSAIRTEAAAVTRAADVLSYAEYPEPFLTNGFRVIVAPDCTSAELVTSTLDMRIVQAGDDDYLRIRRNGANVDVDLVCAAGIVATRTITMATRALPLTITAQPAAGTLTVSGATTGDGTTTGAGTAWDAASILYIGADNAAANGFFGRIGNLVGV